MSWKPASHIAEDEVDPLLLPPLLSRAGITGHAQKITYIEELGD